VAKVAVVGGGAAGIGAAATLARAGVDVALFEAEPRLGGHCFGVPVSLWDRRTILVDAGVSDFNPTVSASLSAFMHELDLRLVPANRDVSFMLPDRTPIWFTREGQPQFRRPIADQQRFLDDLDRFDRTCREVLDDAAYADWPAARYLDEKGYSGDFRTLWFEPRLRGSISFPDPPDRYPIGQVAASWRMHGIAAPSAELMSVQGGMHTWCAAAERWLRQRKVALHLATRVVAISRPGDGIRLRAIDRDKASLTHTFDHVVIATDARQATALLEDAADEEARTWSAFAWRSVSLVVHQDPHFMPADRAAWAARNYLVAQDGLAGPAPVTIYPNRLQSLPASIPDVFVTLDPHMEPAADTIISDRIITCPVTGPADEPAADLAVQRVDALQGKRRTWFCGGYLREPFVHEQAWRSGVEAAQRLVEAVADESRQFEAGIGLSPGGFDDFLRDIPLFADLAPSALAEVQLVARPFQAEAGTMLFRQGEPSDGLYLIKRGEVAISRRVPGDELVTLAVRGPGAVIGEMSLLDHNPRSAHVVAVTPLTGYFVSHERFQPLRSDYRPAAFAVMNCVRREVVARARTIIEEIAGRAVTPELLLAPPMCGDAAQWPPPSPPAIPQAILQALPFFRSFRPDELSEFVAPLSQYEFKPGQLVYAAGEPPRGCLIIVRGALGLNFSTAAGMSMFSVLGPGRLAGELALIDGGPQPLACVAREPTIAFEVDRIAYELMSRGGTMPAYRFFEAVTTGIVAVLRRASAHQARLAPRPGTPAAQLAPATAEAR
jgi:predicted NAD/FAD-binding protein/CRP-like cAMP-binding protein